MDRGMGASTRKLSWQWMIEGRKAVAGTEAVNVGSSARLGFQMERRRPASAQRNVSSPRSLHRHLFFSGWRRVVDWWYSTVFRVKSLCRLLGLFLFPLKNKQVQVCLIRQIN